MLILVFQGGQAWMKIALLDRQNDRWQSPGGGWPPYWRYPNSNKRNGKSGGWYRSRFIWTGRRRRPRYRRNVRQVAPQHHRNSAIYDHHSCSRYWMAVGTDAPAPLKAFQREDMLSVGNSPKNCWT